MCYNYFVEETEKYVMETIANGRIVNRVDSKGQRKH